MCRSRTPIKISRLQIREHLAAPAPTLGHGVCRMGAGHFARRLGALRRDGNRPANRRDVRAQPLERRHSARASPLPIWPDARRTGPAIGASFSAGTAGSTSPPRSAGSAPLSGAPGAGLDPCGALQTSLDLEPGETIEIVFFLGEAASADEAQSAAGALSTSRSGRRARSRSSASGTTSRHGPGEDSGSVDGHHAQSLAALSDAGLPHLGTLRLLSGERRLRLSRSTAGRHGDRCRRSRDHARRICCARPGGSSREGDVQHWWLPPTGQGVRTRISDDRVWLAYAAAHYLDATSDVAILEEPCRSSKAQRSRPAARCLFPAGHLRRDRDVLRTLRPRARSQPRARCARPAVDRHRRLERRHEPCRRTGRAKASGSAGSCTRHSLHSHRSPSARNEAARAARWLAHAAALRAALEREGWDGDWYRRGYFDDGTPLGSATSEECRIDSIAQSWSVISGRRGSARAAQAMAAVDAHLIRRDDGLALLFTPPFDRTPLDPGYVKGYPPGIRENGGQYTHAAAWSVIAFAMLGQGDKAAELFSLLNPINHTSTRTDVHRYKVEPYVVAADIYSVAAARRTRRLDLVHRLRGLDVSRRHRRHSRLPCAGRSLCSRHAFRRSGPASRSPSGTLRALRDRGRKPPGSAKAWSARCWMARPCRMA